MAQYSIENSLPDGAIISWAELSPYLDGTFLERGDADLFGNPIIITTVDHPVNLSFETIQLINAAGGIAVVRSNFMG